jgi:Helicase associated domain
MNALFALPFCDPGKLVEPKPKRLKKSALVKQEEAALNRQEKQSQDDQLFQQMFQLLTQYKQEHGTCHVPKSLDSPLSKWVISIKNIHRRLR